MKIGQIDITDPKIGQIDINEVYSGNDLVWSRISPTSFLYAVGEIGTDGFTTRKYSVEGNLIWSRNHREAVLCLDVDNLGNVYTGGIKTPDPSPYFTIRKYDSEGNLLVSLNTEPNIFAIKTDNSSSFYISSINNNYVRKYDENYNISVRNWFMRVHHMEVDSLDNVYAVGVGVNDGDMSLVKSNSLGVVIWSRIPRPVTGQAFIARSVSIDSLLNVYVSGENDPSNINMRKYDTNGNLLWSKTTGFVRSIKTDRLSNFYAGYNNGDLIKYDTNGNQIWSVNHGSAIYSVDTDNSNNVYIGGNPSSSQTTRKYDTNGNLLWSVNHGNLVWAIKTY